MSHPRHPPANWLRTFELAARYMSFSKAALHLNISTSAVSQQIRNLEDFLGCRLFRRTGNQLYLTDAAEACMPKLHLAFSELQSAIEKLQVIEGRESLSISIAPSLATKWLVERLKRFCDKHPNLDVRVVSTANLESFYNTEIDVSIRYGQGNYPGLTSHLLMTETTVAVAAPGLLEKTGGFDSPSDLCKLKLLHDSSPETVHSSVDWEMIANIYEIGDLEHATGVWFNNSALVVDAARAGLGAGLVKYSLAHASIKNGELTKLFHRHFETKLNYYLVYLPEKKNSPKIKMFQKWVEQEAKQHER